MIPLIRMTMREKMKIEIQASLFLSASFALLKLDSASSSGSSCYSFLCLFLSCCSLLFFHLHILLLSRIRRNNTPLSSRQTGPPGAGEKERDPKEVQKRNQSMKNFLKTKLVPSSSVCTASTAPSSQPFPHLLHHHPLPG